MGGSRFWCAAGKRSLRASCLAYGRDAAKDMHEPMADDEPARKRFVQLAFEGFQSEPGYRERLLQYFENYRFPIKNPFQSFFRVPN